MLRSLLIYLSRAAWAKKLVTNWGFAKWAASRFVAGERLEDAIRVIRELNGRGINATLDHLGEHTTNLDEARRATQDIIDALNGISQSGIKSNVSIKLTQIGLALGEEICADNLRLILRRAKETGNFIRLDMEDSPWVDSTLQIFRQMRDEDGYDNVGVVIQSYLFRSKTDIEKLSRECARVRLCKGAYKEPPDIAFPRKADVDDSFDQLAQIMMDTALQVGSQELSDDGYLPPIPALATHDEKRIDNSLSYHHEIGLPKRLMEYQMLHGIRRDLQEKLSQDGYPVRVYVPYGTQWYPYFMRRLAERPANLWFFISNFFRQ